MTDFEGLLRRLKSENVRFKELFDRSRALRVLGLTATAPPTVAAGIARLAAVAVRAVLAHEPGATETHPQPPHWHPHIGTIQTDVSTEPRLPSRRAAGGLRRRQAFRERRTCAHRPE